MATHGLSATMVKHENGVAPAPSSSAARNLTTSASHHFSSHSSPSTSTLTPVRTKPQPRSQSPSIESVDIIDLTGSSPPPSPTLAPKMPPKRAKIKIEGIKIPAKLLTQQTKRRETRQRDIELGVVPAPVLPAPAHLKLLFDTILEGDDFRLLFFKLCTKSPALMRAAARTLEPHSTFAKHGLDRSLRQTDPAVDIPRANGNLRHLPSLRHLRLAINRKAYNELKDCLYALCGLSQALLTTVTYCLSPISRYGIKMMTGVDPTWSGRLRTVLSRKEEMLRRLDAFPTCPELLPELRLMDHGGAHSEKTPAQRPGTISSNHMPGLNYVGTGSGSPSSGIRIKPEPKHTAGMHTPSRSIKPEPSMSTIKQESYSTDHPGNRHISTPQRIPKPSSSSKSASRPIKPDPHSSASRPTTALTTTATPSRFAHLVRDLTPDSSPEAEEFLVSPFSGESSSRRDTVGPDGDRSSKSTFKRGPPTPHPKSAVKRRRMDDFNGIDDEVRRRLALRPSSSSSANSAITVDSEDSEYSSAFENPPVRKPN